MYVLCSCDGRRRLRPKSAASWSGEQSGSRSLCLRILRRSKRTRKRSLQERKREQRKKVQPLKV
jgi:hypothetical protein